MNVIRIPPPQERGERPPDTGTMGLLIFIASLSMLFLASMAGYIIIRFKADTWPPADSPHLPAGLWFSTIILLGCSGCLHWALKSAKAGEKKPLSTALQITFVLGLFFLANQGYNWWQLYQQGLPVGKNLYAFTFYMLTGLHAVHVIGGLVLLGIVCVKARRQVYSSTFHPGVKYSAMYWHFLDAVWIIMFILMELLS